MVLAGRLIMAVHLCVSSTFHCQESQFRRNAAVSNTATDWLPIRANYKITRAA